MVIEIMEGDWILKKILSILFLILILVGCSNDATQESSVKDLTNSTLPPTVQFEIVDTVYSTEQGSFCWRNSNSANCLSLPSPIEIVEDKNPIKVSNQEKMKLLVQRQPSHQTLTITSADTHQSEELEINKNNQFKAPDIEGIYILSYYAIWEKDDSGTSGDSSFIFKIEVK